VPNTQKTLTVMFTDIAGFTRRTESVSRAAMMKQLETHNALLMPIVAHFDGRIVKSIGDALLVVFESPTNALQCGMLMQHRLREHNERRPPGERIEIKVSINTGEVTVTDGDVFGDPVNVASKVEKATQPGEIYFTEATFLAMNKAEVPNVFVKTFRPRGSDSEEIKLFKVVQDADDPVYRHVVEDTRIDEAAIREKAAALASVSGREAARWADAFEQLSEMHHRSTRTLIAVVAGVLVLGVVLAIVLSSRSGGGGEPVASLATDVRTLLAAGKPDDARRAIATYESRHGRSEEVEALRREVRDAACSAACVRARELLAEGKEVEAVSVLEEAEDPADRPKAVHDLIARAKALGRAKERLAAGDAEAAIAAARESAGDEPPSGAADRIVKRATALLAARDALAAPEAERASRALSAIAAVSQAYGDDTGDPAALDVLGRLLATHLGDLARTEGRKVALERLEESRKRFVHFAAWAPVRREVDLQSLWGYANDPALRRAWGRWDSEELVTLLASLREAAKTDAAFAYRLGTTMAAVTKKAHIALTLGMDEIEAAVALDPKVLDAHEAEIVALATEWLEVEQPHGSFGRRVIAERAYERLKPRLVEALWAVERDDGAGDPDPDLALRANALAVLVQKGDVALVGDGVRWIDDALPVFVEGGESPSLTVDHAKAVFATLDDDARARMERILSGAADEARAKEGRFGVYANAPAVLEALRDALRATPKSERK
jgi:class 3 adenylate cyclase